MIALETFGGFEVSRYQSPVPQMFASGFLPFSALGFGRGNMFGTPKEHGGFGLLGD